MSVVIETTLGDVTVDLYIEERPQACLNFLKLCKIKYYNLCLFHSVATNFIAQTGDPTGKGDGGESIFGTVKGKQHRLFPAEKLPRIKHDQPGLLSMVNHGNGLLGSQFIVTLSDDLSSLDQEHCVFGKIVEGQELLLRLNDTITDSNHRPYQDIRITHTVVLEDPFQDPDGLFVPPLSPLPPSTKDIAYSRIPADEPLNENYSPEELDEMVQQREAAARATILEMIGDIPDADIAPPENVLFVCKLNPVTTDHDLSIIFSRFGNVKSCEVIRDQVTGDSLQYAFIEFEDRKACEAAYFKMDNVLIDDRRIHVDFSQSVAKLKWKGKGRGVEHLDPASVNAKDSRRQNERKQSLDSDLKHEKRHNLTYDHCNHNNIAHNNELKKHIENNDTHKSLHKNIKTEEKLKLTKANEKRREKINKKKRKKTVTSSSSGSTSESSSSSESTESDYRKKRKNRSRKVLVVVKTPRKNKLKKNKKGKLKSKKYETESESESDSYSDVPKKRKKKHRKESTDSSSEALQKNRRKRKIRKSDTSSDEEVEVQKKKRKKKRTEKDSSEMSSDDEKTVKKTRKRKLYQESSSDSEPVKTVKKRKKDKARVKSDRNKDSRKHRKKYRSSTETSSSD